MSNERTRVSYNKRIVKNPDDKGFKKRVIKLVYRFDPILREWSRKATETTTYEPLSEKDGVRELVLKVIEQRQAINSNLEPIQANFLRTITIKVNDDYEGVLLTQANNRVFLNDLNSGLTRELSMIEIFRGQQGLKCTISKPKRISDVNLQTMLKNKEIYPYPIQIIGSGQNLDVRLLIPMSS